MARPSQQSKEEIMNQLAIGKGAQSFDQFSIIRQICAYLRSPGLVAYEETSPSARKRWAKKPPAEKKPTREQLIEAYLTQNQGKEFSTAEIITYLCSVHGYRRRPGVMEGILQDLSNQGKIVGKAKHTIHMKAWSAKP
jgi:ribosomal protein S25